MTKEIEFFSLNMAGWKWTATEESWESRLNKECEYIKSKINNTLVIALQEVQLSGGKYLEIFEKHFPDYHIVLPETDPLFAPFVATVILQYLAYYVSVEKGLNVDQPRNLAKSVTVE